MILNLFKSPNVRTILIALALFYLIEKISSQQYVRNMLALPVLIWIVYSFYSNYRKARQARLDLIKTIHDLSQVSNESWIDTCNDSALAVNYNNNTIYLIDGKIRKTIPAGELLRWEMFPAQGTELTGIVVGGSTSTPQGQAAAGAAMGYGVFYILGRLLFKRKDIGYIKFWINDAERSIVSVYISNKAILDQLQHFSMTIGHKIL